MLSTMWENVPACIQSNVRKEFTPKFKEVVVVEEQEEDETELLICATKLFIESEFLHYY